MTRTTIGTDTLRVGIDSRGAELGSVRIGGTELLWQRGEPWGYSAPVLFPIISKLPGDELLHDGIRYPIKSHGVARLSEFELAGRDEDAATFVLRSNEFTRSAFPFEFELQIAFSVADSELTVSHRVLNTGSEPLPFLLGAHPAFLWPLPGAAEGADHTVSWQTGGSTMRQAVNGLLPERFDSPAVDGTVVLDREQFALDAMLFDDLVPRSATYSAVGAPSITMHFGDFSRFGIWSKAEGGDFVCLEPWSGYPAAADFDGDIVDLPEAELLVADESRTFTYTLEIREP